MLNKPGQAESLRPPVELPPGWVLVPATPTEAMTDAGDGVELRHQAEDADRDGYYTRSSEVYAAMIRAAPNPPSPSDAKHRRQP